MTVTRTTAPGNTITVAATNTDTSFTDDAAHDHGRLRGAFLLAIPLTAGTWVLNIVADEPVGQHRARDAHRGLRLQRRHADLDADDPDNDDNGPGNFAYPTAGDFHAGAYDLAALRGLRRRRRHRLPRPHARPDADLRQPARRPAPRRLRPRPGRQPDLDGGLRSRSATT